MVAPGDTDPTPCFLGRTGGAQGPEKEQLHNQPGSYGFSLLCRNYPTQPERKYLEDLLPLLVVMRSLSLKGQVDEKKGDVSGEQIGGQRPDGPPLLRLSTWTSPNLDSTSGERRRQTKRTHIVSTTPVGQELETGTK